MYNNYSRSTATIIDEQFYSPLGRSKHLQRYLAPLIRNHRISAAWLYFTFNIYLPNINKA